MAKKYSKYNVYQGCTTMCSYKEAVEEINTGKVSADTLHHLEARVILYQRLFAGIGNKKEEAEEFKKKCNNILSSFSQDEKDEYQVNLQKEIAEQYDEASKEYLNRISNISPISTAGKEDGIVAFDRKMIKENKQIEGKMTRFKRLSNLHIPLEYRCDDKGVYKYDKKEMDYVRICDAISIKSLLFDDIGQQQYIEIEYYDEGKVKSICFGASQLANSTYEKLMQIGIVINNKHLFTQYLNDLRTVDRELPTIKKGKANMSYGYIKKEDGSLDFNIFIGIGKENKIIPLQEYTTLDSSIFCKKGTVDGFIDFLAEVSKGKYCIDFQTVVAASLSCIVQAYINNGLNIVAPPAYIFVGRTSIGKGLLSAIANNIWSKPDAVSLICSSDSSNTFMYAMKHRIQYLPFILADIQDLLNRSGKDVTAIADIVFSHSNGQSGGKGTITGEIRSNMRYWQCPLIAFNEADVFSGSSKVTGGADARITILDLKIAPEDRYLTEKSPQSYLDFENENYGVLGEAFVLAMRDKTPKDIVKRFSEITSELEVFGVQEKQANSLGMLVLTDELLREFGLIPSEWNALSCKRLVDWNGIKKITDPTEEMYTLMSEYVVKDPSYVSTDDEVFTKNTEKEVFDFRMKTEREIRGRIVYERKNENGEWISCHKAVRERSLLLIPALQLEQLFRHLKKESDLETFGFDKKRWAQNGWLLKSDTGYTFKGKYRIGITRPYDSKNREYHYAILLKENNNIE